MRKFVSNIKDKLLHRRKKVTIQANILSIKLPTGNKPKNTAYAVCHCDEHDGEFCSICEHFHSPNFGTQ